MKIRRILSLVLALVLCSAMALAEEGDLQSELDAANARIAELEAQVELYRPYYDAQVIVEYDGGVIFLDDVLAQYERSPITATTSPSSSRSPRSCCVRWCWT